MAGQENRKQIEWDAASVYFSEIALKGGNRRPFTQRLRSNLQRSLQDQHVIVESFHDRLLVRAEKGHVTGRLLDRIAAVFGVSHTAPVRILSHDLDEIKAAAIESYRLFAPPNATFAVRAKRSDKQFPLTSTGIEREVGGAVKDATGATVCLDDPDFLISLRVHEGAVYMEGPHVAGPDGLPLGVSGKVLCMFSGGIDSPVAAWEVMKRGCRTDFIHFHTFADVEQLRESKIVQLIEALLRPHAVTARLFLVPYQPFEMGLLSAAPPPDLELILFRRFMARTASELARRKKLAAVVTGDNLAQVASQTMENLIAFDDAATRMIIRPLMTANKQDIVTRAKKIGTYALSIESYKDCCSIVARHPHTTPRLDLVRKAEEPLPVADMTEQALAQTVEWRIGAGTTTNLH